MIKLKICLKVRDQYFVEYAKWNTQTFVPSMVTYLTLGKFESNTFIICFSLSNMRGGGCPGVEPGISPYITHNYCTRCEKYLLKIDNPGRYCPHCSKPVRHSPRYGIGRRNREVKRYG
jgi:hypothetical protein